VKLSKLLKLRWKHLKKIDMRDYLLDTNVWSDWYNPKKNSEILQHTKRLPTSVRLHISVITIGEIDFGLKIMTNKEQANFNIDEFGKFLGSKTPNLVSVDKHTANMYGRLRAQLFRKYAPKGKKINGLRPEQLVDPVTSLELGIQENDLWITAQAMSRNLILVTNDKLHRIIEVAGSELTIENWTKN